MSAQICWCCQVNIAWSGYEGTKYLDEEGRKPCFECVQEFQEHDSESLEDEDESS